MRILPKSFLLILLVFLLTSLTGCLTAQTTSSATTTTTTSTTTTAQSSTDDQITWQGVVLEVDVDGKGFLASVDDDYQKMLGDKAYVDFYADAKIVLDLTGEPINMATVPAGSRVIVTITGGIRESYPVQVSATEVRVILASGTVVDEG